MTKEDFILCYILARAAQMDVSDTHRKRILRDAELAYESVQRVCNEDVQEE